MLKDTHKPSTTSATSTISRTLPTNQTQERPSGKRQHLGPPGVTLRRTSPPLSISQQTPYHTFNQPFEISFISSLIRRENFLKPARSGYTQNGGHRYRTPSISALSGRTATLFHVYYSYLTLYTRYRNKSPPDEPMLSLPLLRPILLYGQILQEQT